MNSSGESGQATQENRRNLPNGGMCYMLIKIPVSHRENFDDMVDDIHDAKINF